MADINFIIPANKSELLSEGEDKFYVKEVIGTKILPTEIHNVYRYFKEEGPEYIFESFHVYYSVLHHSDILTTDIINLAFQHLHRVVTKLNQQLVFVFNDDDSIKDNTELQAKYKNLLKMLLYLYINMIILIERKIMDKVSQNLQNKRHKKDSKEETFRDFNEKDVLLNLNNIMQRQISIFWDPPVVERAFIVMVAEVCYCFLENESIKYYKENRVELFSLLGILIKTYDHGEMFVIRMVQLIRLYEHLTGFISEGIEHLVTDFNTKGLVHNFVRQVTEWQIDEKFQDLQGTRNCAIVISKMAELMPNLMIPEMVYLNRYLCHESYTLRNAVLSIITEIVLTLLTKDSLSEEEQTQRQEFLDTLQEHLLDVSAHVRSKVYQHWARLQKENSIPIKRQHSVLQKAVVALRDKSAFVRKSAADCVTTFLTHNVYGAKLQINYMKQQFEIYRRQLNDHNIKLEGCEFEEIEGTEVLWTSLEDDFRTAIREILKGNVEIPKPDTLEDPKATITAYLEERKFKEAFAFICEIGNQSEYYNKIKDNFDEDEITEFYIFITHSLFTQNFKKRNASSPTEEDLEKLKYLQSKMDYYKDVGTFLVLIDRAIKPMLDLLESAMIGDVHEAVEFFVAAYQFNIDNGMIGVIEMLRVLQYNDADRTNIITEAFRRMYLVTDAKTVADHTTAIVYRLVNLLKTVFFCSLEGLTLLISEWSRNNILDNSIIDVLWRFFTKSVQVSDDDSRAALQLLGMCSSGRKNIIQGNIKMVATIAFGERGANDLHLVQLACELLTNTNKGVLSSTTQNNPPFRIKNDDPIWKNLMNILIDAFMRNDKCYNNALKAAINIIYTLCSKPDVLCEHLIENILEIVNKALKNDNGIQSYVISQLANMLGAIAIGQLNYLDNTVYIELKRRQNMREKRKQNKNDRPSSINNSLNMTASKLHESVLEGAQAEDADAEFILHLLENEIVCGSGLLGKLAYIIKGCCEKPNLYKDPDVHVVCVIALLRYMTVSSKFCEQHVQLIFTILEKSTNIDVKSAILIHCSDLLERFPNVIEPWTTYIYMRLKDDSEEVRKTTLSILINLILKDMLRPHTHISDLALLMLDANKEISDMTKHFFKSFAGKGIHLYNALPDIFSHLATNEEITEDKFRFIMKFLFELINNNKLMEKLVERFCNKFPTCEEDQMLTMNIAYCLTLINYNEKAVFCLLENFDLYKHSLHNERVADMFKTVINNCSKLQKNVAKNLLTELEEKIKSFQKTGKSQDNNEKEQPFKKPKSTRHRKRKNAEKNDWN